MVDEGSPNTPRQVERRGRPREVEDAVRVCVRVSAPDYDRLDAKARAEGRSVPSLIRDAISALKYRPL